MDRQAEHIFDDQRAYVLGNEIFYGIADHKRRILGEQQRCHDHLPRQEVQVSVFLIHAAVHLVVQNAAIENLPGTAICPCDQLKTFKIVVVQQFI